jgi:hypothetical protein
MQKICGIYTVHVFEYLKPTNKISKIKNIIEHQEKLRSNILHPT